MLFPKLVIFIFLSRAYTASCADGEVMVITTSESPNNDDEVIVEDVHENGAIPKFIPTHEWQTILPGQAIPQGLHVRINLQTGLKEAKLMEEASYSVDTLKDALSKIPNDEGNAVDSQRPEKRFRPMEVLQEELAELKLNLTTEAEIVGSLVQNCFDKNVTNEKKIELFNELEYYVHQYDNAQDFIKIGGLKLVSPALNSSDEKLKIAAAELIGSAMQGNPSVQVSALDDGLLQLILHRLAVDSIKVQNKLLYALSSMIRHFPFAQKKFMDLGGISILTKFFREEGEDGIKLQIKSINLVYDMILEKQNVIENVGPDDVEKLRQYNQVHALEAVVKHGWCKIIPQLLNVTQHDLREKVLLTMLVIAKSCQSDFLDAASQLKILNQKYSQLATRNVNTDIESIDVGYYKELQQLTSRVLLEITEKKDEL